jgi:FRG domain-containing protein
MIVTELNFVEVEKYLENKYSTISEKPRYFFRGQRKEFTPQNSSRPSIKTSISIVNGFSGSDTEKKKIRSQAYRICMLSGRIAGGMAGDLNMKVEDALALMQHYLWLSPVLDISGTISVAMFFAGLYSSQNEKSIIYVIDAEKVNGELLLYDHDFLMYDLKHGGLRHRWLRQDGYGISLRNFTGLTEVEDFDLVNYEGVIVEAVKFNFPSDYKFDIDLMEAKGDPLPGHFKSVMRNTCRQLFGTELHPYLKERIDLMYTPVPEEGQVKNFREIFEKYLKYGNIFTICFLEKALNIVRGQSDEPEFNKCLNELNNISKIEYWDMAVHASTEYILKHIERFSKTHDEEIFSAFKFCYEKSRKKSFPDH